MRESRDDDGREVPQDKPRLRVTPWHKDAQSRAEAADRDDHRPQPRRQVCPHSKKNRTVPPPLSNWRIAVLGAALAAILSNDLTVAVMAGLSVVAVLAVEPLADRLWYARKPPGPAS